MLISLNFRYRARFFCFNPIYFVELHPEKAAVMNEKITINDIALRTGLSKGTVDRVLHNRGEVSKKSYQKVMDVIRELDYEPNLYASLLARSEQRTIALLLPDHRAGSYWALASAGEQKARPQLKPMSIVTKQFNYDQYSAESFRAACTRVLESQPSGVVIAPMFHYETTVFAKELLARSIPYVLVDNILDMPGHLAFYGIPAYKSGYLCAAMLTLGQPVKEALIVRILRDKERQSDPTVKRRAGFMDYMLEHCPGCTIRTLFIDPEDPAATDDALSAFFGEFPGVRHIAMLNSRLHLIAPYLVRHPANRQVVGFDNLEANLAALKRGTVSALIAQRPEEQVRQAVQALAERIVFQRTPEKTDNYMHMDILIQYNAEDY